MGQDPKPSKRRRPSSPGLPMLPPHRSQPGEGPLHPPLSSTNARQARVPSGPDTDTTVIIPGLHNVLEQLAGLDPDGFFKATTGDDGKSWFLAWRWQRGRWAGHYVMARVLRGELGFGLSLLLEKVAAVRGGWKTPTRDRYGE